MALTLLVVGCSAEESFTLGRLEVLCDEYIPVCNEKASCVLDDETFLSEQFPGGFATIVHSAEDGQTLVMRFLLLDAVYPGTLMEIRAHTPGCLDFAEERIADADLFEIAGKDGVLEFHLPLGERGDHLVEVFSDMTARYLMTVEVE